MYMVQILTIRRLRFGFEADILMEFPKRPKRRPHTLPVLSRATKKTSNRNLHNSCSKGVAMEIGVCVLSLFAKQTFDSIVYYFE